MRFERDMRILREDKTALEINNAELSKVGEGFLCFFCGDPNLTSEMCKA